MRSFIAITSVLALAQLSASQSNYTYTIDPESVDIGTREQWCTSQQDSCPLICAQVTHGSDAVQHNDCDPDTLAFNCVCENGMTPNATEYSQTIPYFECTEWGNQCVADCGTDNACSNSCRADHPCGAQSPKRVNASTTTSSAASSGTGAAGSGAAASASTTQDYSGFGGTSSGAASALKIPASFMNFGSAYGFAIVFGGLFAGAALIL